MFILFALVFMRMTGAIALNPILGRSNIPNPVKGAMILVLSFLLYGGTDGVLTHEPAVMLEFGFMLIKEMICNRIFHGAFLCGGPFCGCGSGLHHGTVHGADL